MDLQEIQKLIEILEDSAVTEFEVTNEEETIRIHRAVAGAAGVMPAIAPMVLASQVAAADAGGEKSESRAANIKAIISPMVGTFYRAPAPGKPDFAKEGDTISKGQILSIVEAMKLMNEIESDYSGRIVKILVDNASPVEYGEELFLIETD